jgi:dihydroxyacid dehydratase/phosphogluconate dehydratase
VVLRQRSTFRIIGNIDKVAASVKAGICSRLIRSAFEAGCHVSQLIHKEIKSADIMTLDAFKNDIRVLMAIGFP